MSVPPPWEGQSYYGRAQLKAAPFNNWVVGGYVALAGMCGAASTLSGVAALVRPEGAAALIRRERWLSLLPPTLGAGLLVWDLHTPHRFMNMFRVAKGTSPMSIGTWILGGYSLSAIGAAGLHLLGWRRAAAAAHVPAAGLGMGLGSYTAALMAATSTPLWAAAPRALGVRFGAASVASGAAALTILQPAGPTARALQSICAAALTVELATDAVQTARYHQAGVAPALSGGWGLVEKLGATGAGVALPLALFAAGARRGGRGRLPLLASGLVVAGSLLLRVSMLAAGGKSAEDPAVSLRFAQPDNLPRVSPGRRSPRRSSRRLRQRSG